VLFVGRLVEKKGCEYLIRAFAKVQETVPDAILVIIGDGPLRDHLKQLAQKLNIRVQFRGPLTHVAVQQECRLARVICLPSITAANGDAEGLPLVVLESQASGVPVVTSARGADEAVKDGHTGYIFPEGDVVVLGAKLRVLLTDDNIARSMSAAGSEFIALRFAIARCTEALESEYDLRARARAMA